MEIIAVIIAKITAVMVRISLSAHAFSFLTAAEVGVEVSAGKADVSGIPTAGATALLNAVITKGEKEFVLAS